MAAKRKKAIEKLPALSITVDPDTKSLTMSGHLNREQTRMLLTVARHNRCSFEEAMHLCLEKGAEIMNAATPVDGQSREDR